MAFPKKLCGLEIEEVLGKGIQSTVYKTKEGFALKRIKTLESANVIIELNILRTIKHQNIISAKNILFGLTGVCLVLELGNITLRDWIVDPAVNLTDDQKLNLSLALMEAVDFLHKHHILHLDLHVENVLFFIKGAEITPKIIDFGMARFFNKGKIMVKQLPNPAFCPPELLIQSLGGAKYFWIGPGTDNWALASLISVIWQKRTLFYWDQEDHKNFPKGEIIFLQMKKTGILTEKEERLAEYFDINLDKYKDFKLWEDDFIGTVGHQIISYLISSKKARKNLDQLLNKFGSINPEQEIISDPTNKILEEFILTNFHWLSQNTIKEAISIGSRITLPLSLERLAEISVGLAKVVIEGNNFKDSMLNPVLKNLTFDIYRPV